MSEKYDNEFLFFRFKDTVNFNAAHGCMKCQVVGKYSHISKTMIFTNINAEPRTNESFRNKADPAHHKGETPLSDLPIDMVLDIPVGDELHLLHLGLMRKFLYGWKGLKDKSFGMHTKWSGRDVKEISAYLISCNEFKPSEIHRKIRPLSELPRWKGTELRTFLLYTSLPVLKKFLPDKCYKHYLLFYCSVVILGSEFHCEKMIDLADEMIKSFLNLFKTIYGIEHFTSNLHNLIHLVDEVRRFGVLSKFNAYGFENKLQTIKRLVRSGNLPLNQIAKRILESQFANDTVSEKPSKKVQLCKKSNFDCKRFKKMGQIYTVFRELKVSDFHVINNKGNQWVFTRNCDIICVKYFVSFSDKSCYFYGSQIRNKESLFDVPFDSDVLFIYRATKELAPPKLYSLENMACKLFCLPYFGSFGESEMDEECPEFDYVFVPLWHTLK